MADKKEYLKNLPATHVLLSALHEKFPTLKQEILKRLINTELDALRNDSGLLPDGIGNKAEIQAYLVQKLEAQIRALEHGSLHKVINATGVVLHTGLGRAPIDPKLIARLTEVSRYGNLEFDLQSGKRGQRNDHLSGILQILTGAEDGFAVNNNAAAVLLMLNTLGAGKEVILSRGEMIEIGGSFRLPEVMRAAGCVLHEIGTTNKTHLRDYEDAINENTGAILICHSSNFSVEGFTHKPQLEEIVAVAHAKGVPVIYDLGSGSTEETARLFGGEEPEVTSILKAGVELVSFSGDKLLGGPQAGIIVGKREYVQKCAKNHLLRALRLDKFMIKIIQLILTQYLYDDVSQRLEAHRALMATREDQLMRYERFYHLLPAEIQNFTEIKEGWGKVGSGAYPLLKLPSAVLQIRLPKVGAQKLSRALRLASTPVITYIEDDAVRIDLRTVAEDEEPVLLDVLKKTLSKFVVK